eukprot:g2566.t1
MVWNALQRTATDSFAAHTNLSFAARLLLAGVVLAANTTDRPTIGILTVPTQRQCVHELEATGAALGPLNSQFACMIPMGYVKLVEMGQARAVLLPCRVNDRLRALVQSVNGFLFTGMFTDYQCKTGARPYELTGYGEAGRLVIDHVLEQNRRGVRVPLFAECKGFNMLMYVLSGAAHWTDIIRDDIQSIDQPAPIAFNPAIDPSTTRVWQAADAINATRLLTTGKNLMNRHPYGLLPVTYAGLRNITDIFGPYIATTTDRAGVAYVSLVEALGDVPITGVATHPEKVLFEWREGIVYPRGADAVRANLFWGPMLAGQARRNGRAFASGELEASAVAYNTTSHRVFDSRHLMGGEFRQLVFTERVGQPTVPPCGGGGGGGGSGTGTGGGGGVGWQQLTGAVVGAWIGGALATAAFLNRAALRSRLSLWQGRDYAHRMPSAARADQQNHVEMKLNLNPGLAPAADPTSPRAGAAS